jgi:hypothetical protein
MTVISQSLKRRQEDEIEIDCDSILEQMLFLLDNTQMKTKIYEQVLLALNFIAEK